MIIWYLLGIFLLLIVACEFYTFKTGVPTVTSFPSVRKKMIEILKKEEAAHASQEPFTVLDLGSGTGKLALEIAQQMPKARVLGIEISFVPYLLSHLRRLVWRVGNVSYNREDFWPYDLSGVDAIVIYVNANIRDRMAEKLKADLPPGSLVISNETHLPGWDPVDTHKVGSLNLKVVVYRQG